MLGSLTVLPAVLSKLGDRIDKGRVPFIGRAAPRRTASRACGAAILDRVLRRPLVVGRARRPALLLALAIPALGMHTGSPGFDGLPAGPADHADLRPHPDGVPGRRRARRSSSSRPTT